jgi:hypothetical protein
MCRGGEGEANRYGWRESKGKNGRLGDGNKWRVGVRGRRREEN